MKPNLLLIGGPGAGKGTQSERLSQWLGVPHLSTGEIFRQQIALGTALGKEAAIYIDRGRLVPDNLADLVAEERLALPDAQDGYVLDGYPRSLPQALELARALKQRGHKLDAAIYLDVPDEDIMTRLSGRLTCRSCGKTCHALFYPPRQAGICDACGGELYQRNDDNPASISARLRIFHGITGPMLDYYRGKGLLISVDATTGMEKVSEQIRFCVQGLMQPVSAVPVQPV
ncbi:MAG: adenylate kinase [Methylacidiphilales bacterium]|nr:adenylate kinase [Candidatus Methylacidiphilales bacterium]